MARVKGALMTRKRRKKILKLAKGYYGAKSKLFRTAKEAVMKSGQYAYIGRRQKKRDFRRLWITRISAAAKINGMNYSTFMNGMKKAGITLNRKMLAELAVSDAAAFAGLAEKAKAAPQISLNCARRPCQRALALSNPVESPPVYGGFRWLFTRNDPKGRPPYGLERSRIS